MVVLLSALTFSGYCFAKEKIVKDPYGTKCKVSNLAEVVSISKPMLLSEMPAATPEVKMDKRKYITVKFKFSEKGEFVVNDTLIFEQNDAKVKKLRVGDRSYCQDSIDYED